MSAGRSVAVAVGGCGLLVLALAFDAKPLFVPAIALIAIGGLAPAWVWCAVRGASATRVLAAHRIIEDQPLQAKIEVHRSVLGLPGAEVIDPVTEARFALSGPLSPIRGGRRASVDVTARFPRRGEHLLPEPLLQVSDPLELARVIARSDGSPQRILVLPRIEPVRWRSGERTLRFDGIDGDQASEVMAAVDLDGLRPYRVGTPASRIHWPALARGAGLIERRLRADGDNRPLIVLDSRLVGASEELLDATVRAAASLALDLGRAGGCGLLLPGDQRPTAIDPELNRWPVAYRRLALVKPLAGSGKPVLGGARGRSGPLIYVTPTPSERLAAALISTGSGSAVLVVPEAELVSGRPRGVRGRMRPMLEVCGCRGFALGVGSDRERPIARAAS
ncbi:MAG: DUF58 domain-containing protein [Solirubrobacteraceae bacterium]